MDSHALRLFLIFSSMIVSSSFFTTFEYNPVKDENFITSRYQFHQDNSPLVYDTRNTDQLVRYTEESVRQGDYNMMVGIVCFFF